MAQPHLAQMLCPNRHCIMAVGYETEEHQEYQQRLCSAVALRILLKQIEPRCDICGAVYESWHVESRPLKFNSLEEALPYLKQCQEAQARTREAMRKLRNAQFN